MLGNVRDEDVHTSLRPMFFVSEGWCELSLIYYVQMSKFIFVSFNDKPKVTITTNIELHILMTLPMLKKSRS